MLNVNISLFIFKTNIEPGLLSRYVMDQDFETSGICKGMRTANKGNIQQPSRIKVKSLALK